MLLRLPLILLFSLLFSTTMKSQLQYGVNLDFGFSDNIIYGDLNRSRMFFTQRFGLRTKFLLSKTNTRFINLNNYNCDIGIGALRKIAVSRLGNQLDLITLQLPIGLSFNSSKLYNSDREIIYGVKYIPSYELDLQRYNHSIQFDFGLSFFFDKKEGKDRKYEVVYVFCRDLRSMVFDNGDSAHFDFHGISIRTDIVH